MKNGDKPAAPVPKDEQFLDFLHCVQGGSNYGLTKREEFAKEFMARLIPAGSENYHQEVSARYATVACRHADALLAALEKG